MHNPRGEQNPESSEDLTRLHAEVLAFNEQMRQAPSAQQSHAWVSFTLGAGTALTVFVVVTLLQRFA